ncbi:hypothetical protein, partial [Sansalvadorimonas verongulae]|uniref:hypothetical protein n=1 Tax=Sansalvadorimonas verongulae TaxID=2172824 RepID=UPI0012BC352A
MPALSFLFLLLGVLYPLLAYIRFEVFVLLESALSGGFLFFPGDLADTLFFCILSALLVLFLLLLLFLVNGHAFLGQLLSFLFLLLGVLYPLLAYIRFEVFVLLESVLSGSFFFFPDDLTDALFFRIL